MDQGKEVLAEPWDKGLNMPGTANYFTLYLFRIEERKHRSIRSHEEGERKKNIDNMELCSI